MGADMLITSLVIGKEEQQDFEVAHRAVDLLRPPDLVEPEEFWDLTDDPETPEGMRFVCEDLHRCLEELEKALVGREFTWTTARGANVYITGGLSWGDSPTEAFELVHRLRAVRGVLAAAGFEDELP